MNKNLREIYNSLSNYNNKYIIINGSKILCNSTILEFYKDKLVEKTVQEKNGDIYLYLK